MVGGRFKVASVASVAVAGLFMGGVAAQSADLGGNCCADLEERVAELEATTARKGNRKQSLTIYGQVAKGVVWHDQSINGDTNNGSIRDMNGRSGTRFGFKGSAKINADLSAGFLMEIGVDNTNPIHGASSSRYSQVIITSKSLGTVKLGQGSEATDGITEIKLGGALSGLFSAGEGSDASSVAAAAYSNSFDGTRDTGVVYNTPTIGGFVVSAGWYQTSGSANAINGTSRSDVAIRYAGEFGPIRVAAGVGYHVVDQISGKENTETISGSASIMHVPTGVFLNGAAGHVNDDDTARHGAAVGDDHTGWAISGGVVRKFNSLGNTSIEVRYTQFDNDANSRNPHSVGVGISQNIDAAAMDIYAMWEHYDTDAGVVDDDVNVISAGMRVRF